MTYIENSVPDSPTPSINSTDGTNTTSQNLNCFDVLSDDESNKMNVSVRWYRNNVLNLSKDYNNSYSNATLFNAVLSYANTTRGQNWSCSLRFYDGTSYTNWVNSSLLTIVNALPMQGKAKLNSSTSLNLTNENLTCYNQSTSDADGDNVKNIINWYFNGVSFESLNVPFEGGSTSSFTQDYSGYSNNGTVNGAIWNATGGYDGRGAYRFDGATDYISFSTSSALNFSASCSFTEMAWIKPNISDTSWHGFLGYAGGGTSTRMPSMWIYDVNEIHAGFGDGSSWQSFTTTTNPITNNAWNHVVATFDGTYYQIYVNGIIAYNATGSWSGVCPNPSYAQIDIGRVDNYFNGTIDDVRIYNQSLSSEQIRAVYFNKSYLITYPETEGDEVWQCSITPNDIYSNGNTSFSNNITIQDTNPPYIYNIVPVNNTEINNPITLSAYTNENAYCEYSNETDFAYGSGFDFTTTGSMFHSVSLGNLAKTSHVYYIKCNSTRGYYNTDENQGQTNFSVAGEPPTHSNPILNSTYGTNYTIENLTCYNISSQDSDGDEIKNIFSWKLNGVSFEVLNTPFEAGSTLSFTQDYSGYSNNGTVNGAIWNSTGGYDRRGAYKFDGINDYISIPSNYSLNFSASCSFTQMAWIKPYHTDAGAYHGFLGYESTARMPSMWVYDINEIHAGFSDGTDWNSFITTTNPITNNAWNHVVATFDGTYYIIYVNGIIAYNATGSWSGECPRASSTRIDIGRVDNYFNGTIDDVRVYNRSLSSEQIRAIYSNKSHIITSSQTSENQTWQCIVTPFDELSQGITKSSNYLTVRGEARMNITIVYPRNISYFAQVTGINYTYYSDWSMSASKCWYNLNRGGGNVSINCGENVSGVTSVEGNNTWTVYYNNTLGTVASNIVSFFVDTTYPAITFINASDEDGVKVNNTRALDEGQNLSIYVNVSDASTSAVWVSVWQSVKDGAEKAKVFFTYLGGILWKASVPTDSTWNLLNYNYTIYANDSGNFRTEYDSNFSLIKMNISINVTPSITEPNSNISVYGHVNLTNSSILANYPINIWLGGNLLLFSNVTPIGTYNNYQNKTDTSSVEFNRGNYYQTTSSGANLTLSGSNNSGNYTKILDAGARVEWESVKFNYTYPACYAETKSFQEGDANGYSGTEDTYIDAGSTGSNYGSEVNLLSDNAPTVYRPLIKFGNIFGNGVNQIPYNSTINFANITLQFYDSGSAITVYQILENWTENQATYTNRLTGTAWSSAGISDAPSRLTTSESSFTPGSAAAYSFSILNAFKSWSNQSRENYGVVLFPGGGDGSDARSSEYSTQSQRPILNVSYTPSSCSEIKIYIRLSNNKQTWTAWQEVSDGQIINDNGGAYRYLEYFAELSSTQTGIRPYLNEFSANYTAIVTNLSGNYYYNITTPIDGGSFSIDVNTHLRTIFGNNSWRVVVTGAPSVPELNAPANGSFIKNIQELNWTNSSDYEGDPIKYILVVDNNSDFSSPEYYNFTIAEEQNPTGDTPSISEQGTYYWKVRAYDIATGNSSWSEVWQFILDSSAPILGFINQTDEEGVIVDENNFLMEGENLTVYVNVSDEYASKVWIVVWESVKDGAEKAKVFFTYIGGILWKAIVPTDSTWNLLNYNYTIYANDSAGWESEYDYNFSLLKGNITLDLWPNPLDSVSNATAYGHLNLTNGSILKNYPINLWLNGTLLLFSNVTPIGTYNNYQNKTETSSTDFNKGNYYNTVSNGENLTLSGNNFSGNYTKIIDAGARVEWGGASWIYQGAACLGTKTYQEGADNYYGTEDTYIDGDNPDNNLGLREYINIDSSPVYRTLIRFNDVIGYIENGIPPNSTISSANISVTIFDNGNNPTVYEVLENWTESQATYNSRLIGTSWSSTGCADSPSRSTITESTFPASTGSISFSILNAFKRWVNGTSNNYGVVLHPGGTSGVDIRSSEYTGSISERPSLTITYSSSDCTNIKVYARFSNDKQTWTSWQEINNSGVFNDGGQAYRYLEYKTELATTNSSLKPYLNELVFNYTAIVTNSSGGYSYNFSSPTSFGDYVVKASTNYNTIYIENSRTLSLQLGVDPEVRLISPSTGLWFNFSNLTLVYNVSDINGDIMNTTLIINGELNQTNSSRILNGIYNNFSINFSNGQYNWTIEARDSYNNLGNTSTRSFYIDLINPNITLLYPINGNSYTSNVFNLSFNATDNMDSLLSCNVILDGNSLGTTYAGNGNITNVSSGALSGGIHYWNVTCVDNAMRSFTSETFSFTISDEPPVVTLVWPGNGYRDDDGEIGFIFNASDDSGFLNCSIYIDGIFNSTNQSAIENHQNNTINVMGISEGNHNWTVECFDMSESSSMPNVNTFSVDLYYPNIELNRPVNGANVSYSNVNFNFSANDTVDSTLSCNISVDGFNYPVSASAGVLTNRLISNLTDGIHYWNVTCSDDVYHTNTSETRYLNVSEAPRVYLNISNRSYYNVSSVVLNYTPYDNTNLSSCNLYLNNEFNQTNSSQIFNRQINNFNLNGLLDGSYEWFVNCSDYSGNTNISEKRVFYIDTNAPNITLYYPNNENVYTANVTFNFSVIDFIDNNLTCNLSIDGILNRTNFNVDNGTVANLSVAGISDGEHTWFLNCTDEAGNRGNSEIFNFTKYSIPQLVLYYPIDGYWFNTSSFNLTYYLEDEDDFLVSYLYINGVFNRTNSTPIINYDYNNFSISEFPEGEYNWTVIATDTTGLNGTDNVRKFYIDTHAPGLILNYPNQTEEIRTNNISFNFSVYDNIAEYLMCNLTLDNDVEFSGLAENGTDSVHPLLVVDGEHTWNVTCYDNASNFNFSQSITFTVEAPPNVTLNYPEEGGRTNNASVMFFYTPMDPIGLFNCSIYLDGEYNKTELNPIPNQENNITINGISEGQHNWTINCTDSDYNAYAPSARIFYVDQTPPAITLTAPNNSALLDWNRGSVTFIFNGSDIFDNFFKCNLTLDGSDIRKNLLGPDYSININALSQGLHYWNVTCSDNAGNRNTSETRMFNLTLPDFAIYSSQIELNTTPKERELFIVNATIHGLANLSSENVDVVFYVGNQYVGMSVVNSQSINIPANGNISVFAIINTSMGSYSIDIKIDPNNEFLELNESNNNATRNVTVESWKYFYGNIMASSKYDLGSMDNYSLLKWNAENYINGSIYIANSAARISWNKLYAIGKDTGGTDALNDFSEIDNALNMSVFNDSVYNIYTNSGTPKSRVNMLIFGREVNSVPVVDSINNSNFVTGILWDSSEDANGQYDNSTKENIVFVARPNKGASGAYGVYDYEARVPANLREYKTQTGSVLFYAELY
ncbi:MAG: LamG-like jellyroll fold domain-containing protein [Candidatus Nanoarchaeia archaeon]